MYDDGDEALGNDVFEREPFLVKFHVKPAGKIVYDLVVIQHESSNGKID